MKKFCILALSLVLTLSMMAGCGSSNNASATQPTRPTTMPTLPPTTQATTPTTEATTTPTTGMIDPTNSTEGNGNDGNTGGKSGNNNADPTAPGSGNPSTGDFMGRARPFERMR